MFLGGPELSFLSGEKEAGSEFRASPILLGPGGGCKAGGLRWTWEVDWAVQGLSKI